MPTKSTTRRSSRERTGGAQRPRGTARRRPSATAARRVAVELDIQYASAATGLPTRAQLRKWAHAALHGPAVVTLRIVDEVEARALNRQYRGKDYATNVLTFAYSPEPPHAADIVLCAPVIAREAAGQGKLPEAHFAHLVVHGALHMQGRDHANAADARVMEALESQIVMKLGYADPYA